MTDKTRTKIKRILLGVFLALFGAILIFSYGFFSSARFRRIVINFSANQRLIRYYNVARPTLNIGNNAACLTKLEQAGITFTPVDDHTETIGCALRYAVRVTQSHISYNRDRLLTCKMALDLSTFEQEVIQPAAAAYFQQNVTRITHLGTYNCRPMRGSRYLLSEHAYANAIDIAAFELADGTIISIKTHWENSGDKSRFLHDIARGACDTFRTVLTPNYNKLHHDHFHLDNSFRIFRKCEV